MRSRHRTHYRGALGQACITAAHVVRVTITGGLLTWTHGGELGLIDPSSVDQFHGVIDRVVFDVGR